MFDFDSMSSCTVKWDWYGNKDPNPTSLTLATDGSRFFVTCYIERTWRDYLDNGKIVAMPLPEELKGLPAEELAYHQDTLLPLVKTAWSMTTTTEDPTRDPCGAIWSEGS